MKVHSCHCKQCRAKKKNIRNKNLKNRINRYINRKRRVYLEDTKYFNWYWA